MSLKVGYVKLVDVAFLVLAVVTVGSAILALESREVVYGAVALALSFLGVAGFFALLDAVFLAMFQLTVYVGAIAVLILFTVMVVRREQWLQTKEGVHRAVGIGAAILVALSLGYIVYTSSLAQVQPALPQAPFTLIGPEVLSEYGLVLVTLSLVLASAVIGAVVLAKLERD